MARVERTPRERETLVYKTPEEATEFVERIEGQLEQQPGDVQVEREVVAETVAEEIAAHGHGVSNRAQPWQHTEDEHVKAQELVNVAFSQNLKAALRQAEKDPSHPRLLDLFHDVLTNELYDIVVEHRMNRQYVLPWMMGTLVLTAVIVLTALLLTLYFVAE